MYAAILETSTAAADRVLSKHGCHVLPLYKKQWHQLCKAFMVEARWHQRSRRPSLREYLANGWVTSTGPLLLLHALPAAGAAAPRRRPGPHRRHLEGVQQGDVSADQSMTMANLCRIHCIYPDVDGITSPTHRMKGTTCSSTVSYSSSHVYWHAC